MAKNQNMSEADLKRLRGRIDANKKKVPDTPKDLFGNVVPESVHDLYAKVFQSIKADHTKVLWIPSNVIGKKNNYEVRRVSKGRTACCDSFFYQSIKGSKGKVNCAVCGNRSALIFNSGVGLKKKAIEYQKGSMPDYTKNYKRAKALIGQTPMVVAGAFFIRPTRGRFDFDNMKTMVGDQLTTSGIIEDDSADKLMLLPLGYIVDPKHPGVLIRFFNANNYINFILNECNKNK